MGLNLKQLGLGGLVKAGQRGQVTENRIGGAAMVQPPCQNLGWLRKFPEKQFVLFLNTIFSLLPCKSTSLNCFIQNTLKRCIVK